MRRLLTLVLLALFGLPLLSPLLALAGGIGDAAESSLPACCRRLGAHHCAMSAMQRAELAAHTPQPRSWSAPERLCPFRSAALAPAAFAPFTPARPAASPGVPLSTHPAGVVQTQCRLRIARARSRHKRGPPGIA